MNSVIILILFSLATSKYYVSSQKYEGDNCKVDQTNENGICKLLSQCPKALADLKARRYATRCGFKGSDIIVCCAQAEQISNTVKSNRQPGEISDQMCKVYSQYVWTKELSPILLVGAEDIVKNECPFNKLELIVGGDPAQRREFPHMTQLGYEDSPIRWGCGGSLISDQFVITAGHCLEHISLGFVLYARMGLTDLDDPDHSQQFNVIERIPHPQYEAPSHYHDIGLVKLDKKVLLNTWVRPACLYTKSSSPWTKVIATGWGQTYFQGFESTVLLRVILELYDKPKCQRVYRPETRTNRLQNGIKNKLMICAGHSKELRDACQGDSGGPLQVYRDTQDKNMSCMYDLIGVTSFGKGCGSAVNIPGVYTRVSNYLKWIEDHVWPQK